MVGKDSFGGFVWVDGDPDFAGQFQEARSYNAASLNLGIGKITCITWFQEVSYKLASAPAAYFVYGHTTHLPKPPLAFS